MNHSYICPLKDFVLFYIIGKKYSSRQGGYTRIYRLPPRRGDATEMALIQLV